MLVTLETGRSFMCHAMTELAPADHLRGASARIGRRPVSDPVVNGIRLVGLVFEPTEEKRRWRPCARMIVACSGGASRRVLEESPRFPPGGRRRRPHPGIESTLTVSTAVPPHGFRTDRRSDIITFFPVGPHLL